MTGERRAKGRRKSKGGSSEAAAEVANDRYVGVESAGDEVGSASKWRPAGKQQTTAARSPCSWLSCIFVVSVVVAVGAAACVFYGDAIIHTLEEYGVDTDSVLRGIYPKSVREDASDESLPGAQANSANEPPSSSTDDSVHVEQDDSISVDNDGPTGSSSTGELPYDEATPERHEQTYDGDSEELVAAKAAETYDAGRLEEDAAPAASVSDDDDVVLSIGKAQDSRLPEEDRQQRASSSSNDDQASADDEQVPPAAHDASYEQERQEALSPGEPAVHVDAVERADEHRDGEVPRIVDDEGTTQYVHDEYGAAVADAFTTDGADFSASSEFTSSPEEADVISGNRDALEEVLVDTEVPSERGDLAARDTFDEGAPSQPEAEAIVDAEVPIEAAPSQSEAAEVVNGELLADASLSQSEADTVDNGELLIQAARDMDGESEYDATSNEVQSQVDAFSNNDDNMAWDVDTSTRRHTFSDAEEQPAPNMQDDYQELVAQFDSSHPSSEEPVETLGPLQSFDNGDAEGEAMTPAPPTGFSKGEVQVEPVTVAPTDTWEYVGDVTGSESPAPDAEGDNSAGPAEETWKPAPPVDSATGGNDYDLKVESVTPVHTSGFADGDSRFDPEDESAPTADASDTVNVDLPSDAGREPVVSSSSGDLDGYDSNPGTAWESFATEAASEYANEDDIVPVNDDIARTTEAASAYVDDDDILRLKDNEAVRMDEAASEHADDENILRVKDSEAVRMSEAASEYVDDGNILRVKVDDAGIPESRAAFIYGSSDPETEREPATSASTLNVDGDDRPYADIDAWNRASAAPVEPETASFDGYIDTEVGNEPTSASAWNSGSDGLLAAESEAWTSASAADSAYDPPLVAHGFSDSQDSTQLTDEGRSAIDEEPPVPSISQESLAAEGDSSTVSAPESYSSLPPQVPDRDELNSEADPQEYDATTW